MGRKRVDLGPGADDRIVAMMARGMGIDAIAGELGGSRSTVARKMKALKSGVASVRAARREVVQAKPAASGPKPLPTDADDPAIEQAPIEQINDWLAMAREQVEIARIGDDVDNLQKMMRIAGTFLAMQQKYTPIAPPDPNEHPDLIDAADKAWARMREIVKKMRGK